MKGEQTVGLVHGVGGGELYKKYSLGVTWDRSHRALKAVLEFRFHHMANLKLL